MLTEIGARRPVDALILRYRDAEPEPVALGAGGYRNRAHALASIPERRAEADAARVAYEAAHAAGVARAEAQILRLLWLEAERRWIDARRIAGVIACDCEVVVADQREWLAARRGRTG